LLIDAGGRTAKVYAQAPSAADVNRDLEALRTPDITRAFPFRGEYVNQPRRDYFKFAAALLWEGQTEAALPYLHEALSQGSKNPRVALLIGQIELQAGRIDRAEGFVQQSISMNDRNPDAWVELGNIYDARNDQRKALETYEKALSLAPDRGYILVNAAQASSKCGEPAKAEAYYRQALAQNENDPEAANGLGLLLAKAGHTDEAKRLLQRAIEQRRDFGSAINNLGVLYLNAGQVNDAVAAFEYGLRNAPDEDILYLNLGRIYARQGRLDRAREVMQQLLARKPGNTTAEHALRELEQR
jgi:tetratricopeptide (TPR) repeat protein